MDPASARSNLLIANTGSPFFKFISARAGKHRMRVSIDEAGENNTPARVHHLTVGIDQFFDFLRAPDSFNPCSANKQRTGRHNAELAHLRSNPRSRRPGKRHHLRTINNRQRHSRYSHAPAAAASAYSMIPQTIPKTV